MMFIIIPKFVIPKRHLLWSDCLQRAMMRFGQRRIMGCCLNKEKKGSEFFILAIAQKENVGLMQNVHLILSYIVSINSENLIAFSPAVFNLQRYKCLYWTVLTIAMPLATAIA